MMSTDPLKIYRQNTIHGSSVADIFIQCYDEIIRSLHGAARAIEAGDIERKTHDLNRVLAFVVHLQAALDFEHGGEAAQWLNHFYVLVRKQIFDGSARLSPDLLREAAQYFADVRRVWEEGRAMNSGNPATSPSVSPQNVSLHSPREVVPTLTPDMTETSSHSDWSA